MNWNLPRFSLILHLLNTLAFYSALDSSLLYVNEVNGFFIHFRRILQGWFQSKSVVNYAQRAVALPFIISAKKHSPSENLLSFRSSGSAFLDTRFFLLWGSLLSSVGPHSISFGASFFRLSSTRSSSSSWANPLRWCWHRTQFSSVRIWGSDHSSRSGPSSIT